MYNRIDLSLTPSTRAGQLACAPWALVAAISATLAWWGPGLLMLGVLPAVYYLRDMWQRCGSLSHRQAVVHLSVQNSNLTATLASGETIPVSVTEDSRITGVALFATLQVQALARRYPVVLLPTNVGGNVEAEQFRRLRVWLRLMPRDSAPIDKPWHNTLSRRFRPGGTPHDH